MGMRNALTTTATIGQIFLIILNIVFALLGIGLIILGAVIRSNNVVDPRIVKLLDKADFQGLNIGDILVALSVIIIIVGIFTVLVAADGGFGACFKLRFLLIAYIIILAIIVLIELIVFGIWCKIQFGTQHWLKEQFDRLFQFYNGIGQDDLDVYSSGWNLMFMLLNCCGSSPITPSRNDFQMLSTFWWSSPQRNFQDVIPYTCCIESNIRNYKFGNNRECTQQMLFYRPRGCYDAFKQVINQFSTPAIVLSVILLIAEIVAVVSAIIMLVQINRNLKRSMNMSNSNLYKQGSHDMPLPDPKPLPSKPH